jgi:homoserine dehydrogenase
VDDRPGQLAKIAECMADVGISLATVSQTPHENNEPASLILTTHQTNEHLISLALEKLKNLPGVMEEPVLFRMFDPNGVS